MMTGNMTNERLLSENVNLRRQLHEALTEVNLLKIEKQARELGPLFEPSRATKPADRVGDILKARQLEHVQDMQAMGFETPPERLTNEEASLAHGNGFTLVNSEMTQAVYRHYRYIQISTGWQRWSCEMLGPQDYFMGEDHKLVPGFEVRTPSMARYYDWTYRRGRAPSGEVCWVRQPKRSQLEDSIGQQGILLDTTHRDIREIAGKLLSLVKPIAGDRGDMLGVPECTLSLCRNMLRYLGEVLDGVRFTRPRVTPAASELGIKVGKVKFHVDPVFIPQGKEPDGFTVEQYGYTATYLGYRYHWVSQCYGYNKIGWVRVRPAEEENSVKTAAVQ